MNLNLYKNSRGFTLVEFLIVIGLVLIFTATTVPYGINVYRAWFVDNEIVTLSGLMERARSNALIGKNGSDWGVEVASENYRLFAVNGSYNREFPATSSIDKEGIERVIFEIYTGKATIIGSPTFPLIPIMNGLILYLEPRLSFQVRQGLAEGEDIPIWHDYMNLNNAIQYVDVNMPHVTYLSYANYDDWYNYPVAVFEGNNFLEIEDFDGLTGDESEIFIVTWLDDEDEQSGLWEFGSTSTTLYPDSGGDLHIGWLSTGSFGPLTKEVRTLEYPHILNIVKDDAGWTVTQMRYSPFQLGGVQTSTFNVPNDVVLGRSLAQYFNGRIAEVAMYDRVLDSSGDLNMPDEKELVLNYLEEKFIPWIKIDIEDFVLETDTFPGMPEIGIIPVDGGSVGVSALLRYRWTGDIVEAGYEVKLETKHEDEGVFEWYDWGTDTTDIDGTVSFTTIWTDEESGLYDFRLTYEGNEDEKYESTSEVFSKVLWKLSEFCEIYDYYILCIGLEHEQEDPTHLFVNMEVGEDVIIREIGAGEEISFDLSARLLYDYDNSLPGVGESVQFQVLRPDDGSVWEDVGVPQTTDINGDSSVTLSLSGDDENGTYQYRVIYAGDPSEGYLERTVNFIETTFLYLYPEGCAVNGDYVMCVDLAHSQTDPTHTLVDHYVEESVIILENEDLPISYNLSTNLRYAYDETLGTVGQDVHFYVQYEDEVDRDLIETVTTIGDGYAVTEFTLYGSSLNGTYSFYAVFDGDPDEGYIGYETKIGETEFFTYNVDEGCAVNGFYIMCIDMSQEQYSPYTHSFVTHSTGDPVYILEAGDSSVNVPISTHLRYHYNTSLGTSGQTVNFEVQGPDGIWTPIGSGTTNSSGYATTNFTINPATHESGTYNFRAIFNGNASEGYLSRTTNLGSTELFTYNVDEGCAVNGFYIMCIDMQLNDQQALDFDTTGYVEIDSTPLAALLNNGDTVTMSVWARANLTDNRYRYIYSNLTYVVDTYHYGLTLRKYPDDNASYPNRLQTMIETDNHVHNLRVSTTTLTAGPWHHFVTTYDGSSVRMYVDGIQEGAGRSASGDVLVQTLNDFLVGRSPHGTSQTIYWSGNILDLRIYDRALSASEVDDLYNKESVSSTGLIGHWPMDEGSGGTVYDQTSNNNHGIIHNLDWTYTSTPE